jgi:hypothetical protein
MTAGGGDFLAMAAHPKFDASTSGAPGFVTKLGQANSVDRAGDFKGIRG